MGHFIPILTRSNAMQRGSVCATGVSPILRLISIVPLVISSAAEREMDGIRLLKILLNYHY